MGDYPRGHKWWKPSPEEERLRSLISEYKTAISLTKAHISSPYHSEFELSRRAIAKYEKTIIKLEKELQTIIDADS